MITLETVSEANRDECLALQLRPEQVEFLPDVRSSLELAEHYPDARPLAIRLDGSAVIGFALIGIDESTGSWKIFRFMIDQEHQHRGHGGLALSKILEFLHTDLGAADVLVVYSEHNQIARQLYLRHGFEEYGGTDEQVLARRRAR